METASRNVLGFKLVAASLLLGIAGDVILGSDAWGLSLPLFTGFLTLSVLALARFTGRKLPRVSVGLLVSAFLFSLCFAWRDAPELKLLNGLAVFALVGLSTLHATGKRLETAPIAEFAVGALGLWAMFVADFCSLVFKDVKWAEAIKEKGLSGTSAVGRGILISIPLLFVFGGLLVSADAGFQQFLNRFTDFDAGTVFTHAFIIIACAVLTGGLMRRLFFAVDKPPLTPTQPPPFVLAPSYHMAYRSPEPFRLGATEIGIILGSLNALFGLFVFIEAPYLFGGMRHVLATEHLGVAEYARRGFFELVAVVGLAIPVLLGSHSLVKRDKPAADRLWRGMSVVMVSLLFVVMQSAVLRMRLYVDLYSLTTERVYVLASLGWMALTLLWFLATTVRGRSERFAFGAFASLLGVILFVNAMNPDAQIVRFNVAQAKPGKKIDGDYLRQLSADATPDLIANFDKLPAETRPQLTDDLVKQCVDWDASWRSWDWSRERASMAVHQGITSDPVHWKSEVASAAP